jgi:hypothetical protein
MVTYKVIIIRQGAGWVHVTLGVTYFLISFSHFFIFFQRIVLIAYVILLHKLINMVSLFKW